VIRESHIPRDSKIVANLPSENAPYFSSGKRAGAAELPLRIVYGDLRAVVHKLIFLEKNFA
jgi:hypothetical protein